jgi:hypothetical protein
MEDIMKKILSILFLGFLVSCGIEVPDAEEGGVELGGTGKDCLTGKFFDSKSKSCKAHNSCTDNGVKTPGNKIKDAVCKSDFLFSMTPNLGSVNSFRLSLAGTTPLDKFVQANAILVSKIIDPLKHPPCVTAVNKTYIKIYRKYLYFLKNTENLQLYINGASAVNGEITNIDNCLALNNKDFKIDQSKVWIKEATTDGKYDTDLNKWENLSIGETFCQIKAVIKVDNNSHLTELTAKKSTDSKSTFTADFAYQDDTMTIKASHCNGTPSSGISCLEYRTDVFRHNKSMSTFVKFYAGTGALAGTGTLESCSSDGCFTATINESDKRIISICEDNKSFTYNGTSLTHSTDKCQFSNKDIIIAGSPTVKAIKDGLTTLQGNLEGRVTDLEAANLTFTPIAADKLVKFNKHKAWEKKLGEIYYLYDYDDMQECK